MLHGGPLVTEARCGYILVYTIRSIAGKESNPPAGHILKGVYTSRYIIQTPKYYIHVNIFNGSPCAKYGLRIVRRVRTYRVVLYNSNIVLKKYVNLGYFKIVRYSPSPDRSYGSRSTV